MHDLIKRILFYTPTSWTYILPSYKLPDIEAANVVFLGVLKGAWCYLADTVWLKDFAVEVNVSADSIADNVAVANVSLVCIKVSFKQSPHVIYGCQLHLLFKAEC